MTVAEALEKARNSPEMGKLTYGEQQEVVKLLIDKTIVQDPMFLALPDAEKSAVYSQVVMKAATTWKPVLAAPSTEEAYVKGYQILDELEKGNPKAIDEAHRWITVNAVTTNSLIAQIATGAKDVVESLFTDDQPFNSLALHSRDYQKLADAMYQRMPEKARGQTQTTAAVLGIGTAAVETIGLNVLFVGAPGRLPVIAKKYPQVFTAKLWTGMETKYKAATTAKSAFMWKEIMPNIADAVVGGGVTDLVRDLPRVIETGLVYGRKDLLEEVGTAFGMGVAFDLVFNSSRTLFHFIATPVAMMLRKMTPSSTGLSETAEALKGLSEENVARALNDVFVGKVPVEILEGLSPELREKAYTQLSRLATLFRAKSIDVNSPEGFGLLAKAMGFDAQLNPKTGFVDVFDGNGNLAKTYKSKAEAISAFQEAGFNDPTQPLNLDDFIIGGQRAGRVRVYGRTKTSIKELSNQNLYSILKSSITPGRFDKETAQSTVLELSRRAGLVRYSVDFLPEDDFIKEASKGWDGIHSFILPQEINQPKTWEALTNYLNPVLKKLSPDIPQLVPGATEVSLEALDIAAKRLGAGSGVEKIATGYQVRWPDGQVSQFRDLRSVNTAVWDRLLDQQMVSVEEFGTLLHRSTGFTLEHNVSEDGVDIFEIMGFGKEGRGKLIQSANSLKGLSNWAAEYNLKLPDFLMPENIIRKGNLVVSETVVTGPVSSMKKFMADFGDPRPKLFETGSKRVRVMPDGSTLEVMISPGGKFIEVEWPTVGLSKTFDTYSEAMNFLDKTSDMYSVIEDVAFRKGYRMDVLPNGKIFFHNGVNVYTVDGLEKAKEFLASQPDLSEGIELVKNFGTKVDSEIAAKIRAEADSLTRDLPPKSPKPKSIWVNYVDSKVKPMSAYIDDVAQQTGRPELSRTFHEAMGLKRTVGGINNRNAIVLQGMFTNPTTGKLMSKQDRKLVQLLLDWDPEVWSVKGPLIANSLGLADGFTEEHVRVAKALRAYYEELGKAYNIDFIGFLKNYGARFREYNDPETMAEILKVSSRDQVANKLFGVGRWDDLPALKFLSRNSRLDNILNTLHKGDALEVAQLYAERGNREMLLGPVSDRMKAIIEGLEKDSSVSAATISSLKRWYGNFLGGYNDEMGQELAETSVDITKKIASGFTKLSKMFGGEATVIGRHLGNMADNVISSDLPGDAGHLVSLSTLGFRWIRLLTNTAQYLNTWSVYGKYAADAMNTSTKETFEEYFRRGILDDKIFASLGDEVGTITHRFQAAAMAPNRSSEWTTRMWTARAQELAFNDALEKLANGTADLKTFSQLAHIDWFPEERLAGILDMVQKGNVGAARDAAMIQAVRQTMFDYSKENWPSLFQSTLGRIYGKFGVYSFGQVEFYRSIATRGNLAFRLMAMARLVAGMTVIKNAFLAAGIDYNGFNLTDPLAFSGSPIWNSMIDLTRVGGIGPESDLARRSLQKDWLPFIKTSEGIQPNIPRLVVPGGVQLNSLIKVGEDLSRGDGWGVFLDFLGAPRSRQPWDGIKTPW